MSHWHDLVAATSPDFQRLHAAIGDLLRARWPSTEARVESGMAAYAVSVDDPPSEEEWKGTMPRTHFIIAPTEKKAGITIHVWHPKHPLLLKDHAAGLAAAGYKPMVGCLQWNRKAGPDLNALAKLLDQLT